LTSRGREELSHIAVRTEPESYFKKAIHGVPLEQAEESWRESRNLPDGSWYGRGETVGEFLVSDRGLQIHCRRFDDAPAEAFHLCLLQRALSFALVKNGFEPIRATVIAVHGEAVVLLGNSGFDRSELARSFISAGYPLLADELVMLRVTDDGVVAYPGPARIALSPKPARLLLGQRAVARVDRNAERVIIPLDRDQSCSIPLPV